MGRGGSGPGSRTGAAARFRGGGNGNPGGVHLSSALGESFCLLNQSVIFGGGVAGGLAGGNAVNGSSHVGPTPGDGNSAKARGPPPSVLTESWGVDPASSGRTPGGRKPGDVRSMYPAGGGSTPSPRQGEAAAARESTASRDSSGPGRAGGVSGNGKADDPSSTLKAGDATQRGRTRELASTYSQCMGHSSKGVNFRHIWL